MIRVFPRRTKWTPIDDLAFVGDPPLFRPREQPVFVSVTFTWDIAEGERLARAWSNYYRDVRIGGPAFGDQGGEFEAGRFIKDGVTITSRGCPWKCSWCFVPKREGTIRELKIKEGYIVQDNNLLACSRGHIESLFEMLRGQRKAAVFAGGLDIRLLKPWHKKLIDSIRVHELWFACDTMTSLRNLERAAEILDGIPQRKRRCYVMIGYGNESLKQAETRLEKVFALGFDPFSQLYRGDGERQYGADWKALNRKWSRPAAYHSST
ncbi:MAG: hypothetical protein FJ006_12845 [Chloroflexi bacterium]|nr:hypothetical protein [Chloroflexota bacterium]